MYSMFNFCTGLTSLDLSGFNTSKVTNMEYMFYGCRNLTTIYAGSGWSTNAVTSSTDMFKNCTNLVGGKGTTYDANHVDKTYAHIDGGTSNPGYFTAKNAGLRGDLNHDGYIDVTDVTMLISMVLGGTPADLAVADLTDDGELDVSDVTALIALALSN